MLQKKNHRILINPLLDSDVLAMSKFIAFADYNFNISQIGYKTLCEKKKILLASIFVFPLNIFMRLLPKDRSNLAFVGNGLICFEDASMNY